MATFEVEHSEGMSWIKATISDETIRTAKGALNHLVGNIVMDVPLPRPRDFSVSLVSDESPIRPRFQGTGSIYLESTLGGYHIMELKEDESWIFSKGAYWASESQINLKVVRERLLTSLWAGEGLFWFLTAAHGAGKVVLSTQGPVEEMSLENERVVFSGDFVVARTTGIKFTIQRPTKSYLSYMMSGEKYARVYEGSGKLLLCTTPFWRLLVSGGHDRNRPIAE